MSVGRRQERQRNKFRQTQIKGEKESQDGPKWLCKLWSPFVACHLTVQAKQAFPATFLVGSGFLLPLVLRFRQTLKAWQETNHDLTTYVCLSNLTAFFLGFIGNTSFSQLLNRQKKKRKFQWFGTITDSGVITFLLFRRNTVYCLQYVANQQLKSADSMTSFQAGQVVCKT